MAGRPSKYRVELGKQILNHYSNGKTILQITRINGMPSRATIYLWRSRYKEFGLAYLVAVEAHVEALVDQGYEIVMSADEKQAKIAQVQSNYLTWLAAKLNRQKYGDKLDVQHNVVLDIAGLLVAATDRMKSIEALPVINGVGTPQNNLIECGNGESTP